MKFPQHPWQNLALFCHHADGISDGDSDRHSDSESDYNVALDEEKHLHNYKRESPAAGN